MRYSVLALVCLLLSSSVFASDFQPIVGTLGKDLSANFDALMNQNTAFSFDLAELKKYKILFVPGFFADYTYSSFFDEASELEKIGLERDADYHIMNHDDGYSGEDSSASNAEAIKKVLLGSERPVILVTHSKGALDTLTALLNHPELRGHIATWFSVQGAVGGSPFADTVLAHDWSTDIMDGILHLPGGDLSSLQDMQTAPCASYLQAHEKEIHTIANTIPIISFATWVKTSELSGELFLLHTVFGAGMPEDANDGVVPTDSSLIPYTDFIVSHGPNHLESVVSSIDIFSTGFDRKEFMDVMLSMALQKIKADKN